MKRYRVTIYFSEGYEVDAGDEQDAQDKADMYLLPVMLRHFLGEDDCVSTSRYIRLVAAIYHGP